MVFKIFKTLTYEDVDDEGETLSSRCLTSNLKEKIVNTQFFYDNLYIFFFCKTSAAKVHVSYCVLTFEENLYVCFTEMHNMNMPEGVPT